MRLANKKDKEGKVIGTVPLKMQKLVPVQRNAGRKKKKKTY